MLNVALGFDEKFAQHACVTIYSVLKNTKSPVNFYLLHSKLHARTKEKIESVINSHNSFVHWIEISDFDMFSGYLSVATYYRLFLTKYCNADKIIYLDSDILVCGDLSELYNIDLEGYCIGAVPDFSVNNLLNQYIKLDLGGKRILPSDYFLGQLNFTREQMNKYFNAGVLLLDLKKLRELEFCKKALKMLENESYAFMDQDCLNLSFIDNYYKLPIKYNFMLVKNSKDVGALKDVVEYKEFISGVKLPVCVHYICKPWQLNIPSMFYAKLYFSYKIHTPWKFTLDLKGVRKQIFNCKLSRKTRYLKIFGKNIIKPVYGD